MIKQAYVRDKPTSTSARWGTWTTGRPLYVRTTDVSGVLDLGGDDGDPGAGGQAEAIPGETVQVTVALGKPVALDAGQTFAIREGGRTVGAGTVTALLD